MKGGCIGAASRWRVSLGQEQEQELRCNDVDHGQTRPLVGLFEGKMPLWNLTRHD